MNRLGIEGLHYAREQRVLWGYYEPILCRICVAKYRLNLLKLGQCLRNGNAENGKADKCFPGIRLIGNLAQNGDF